LKTVALIPARGGSKRIPGKNIIELAGKPLIAYNIIAAQKCNIIDEVWVSTDDPQIEGVAQNFGATVFRRSPLTAGDTASSESALLEFTESQATSFDILVFMQATSPLTQPDHLQAGVEMVANAQADSCLSVSEDVRFYWNAQRKPINYDLLNRPFSQEKERWYKETGAFYITTRDALIKSKCRVSGRIEFVVVPEKYSWEIDTYEDLEIVSNVLRCEQLSQEAKSFHSGN
jgi:N-acylneuraminate cytidylyltransferase